MLTNIDKYSSCYKKSIEIKGLSVWVDDNYDIIIFWICTNNFNESYHTQAVLAYVNSLNATPDWKGILDLEVFNRVKTFTKKMLNFTKLDVDAFDVNEKTKYDSSCISRCSNNCTVPKEVVEVSGYWILIIFIYLVVILICLFVL